MRTAIGTAIIVMAFAAVAFAGLQMGQYHNPPLANDNHTISPLTFIPNLGQWDSRVVFRAEAGGAVFYFDRDEVDYMFIRNSDQLEESPEAELGIVTGKFDGEIYKKEAIMIKARFIGANPDVEVRGSERLAQINNYYLGNNPDKWRSRVPCYGSITYNDIYPGINLRYYGNNRSMKYDFIVEPGADLSRIRIQYEGIDGLDIANDGSLTASSLFGPVYELAPYIYQEKNGQKKEIAGRYVITEPGIFGFSIDDDYDPTIPLVIDPELVYSTYLGGSSYDKANGITVNYLGEAYITGYTLSTDFPVLNPYQPSLLDTLFLDIFITRLNSEGNGIISSTYLGGAAGPEEAMGIELDDAGYVYVGGVTFSHDFPTVNPYQLHQNDGDVFALKFTPDCDSLIYSTCIGGISREYPNGFAIDREGCAYLTGVTSSPNYPTKNPILTDMANLDAFVTKLAPTGESLVYSTYLGGNDIDMGYGIAVDKAGQAYIGGITTSRDFPMVYALQGYVGTDDVFVTKLNPAGSDFRYSTYIAGYMQERAMSLTIDKEGRVYITGVARSSDYPLVNPIQTFQYDNDAIVTKLAPTRCILEFSTYLGGDDYDMGSDIVVDSRGNMYIAGYTGSTNFPTLNPVQTDLEYFDGFFTKINGASNTIEYSTYLAGNNPDYALAIALDRSDNIYIIGFTYSDDFPILNPYQTNMGNDDVFVMKFSNTSGIDDDNAISPNSFLLGNYPNPFNSNALVRYQISTGARVSLAIYNILGERVATLCDRYQEPGIYSVSWDASDASSGTYLCRLEVDGKSEYRKMTLVK